MEFPTGPVKLEVYRMEKEEEEGKKKVEIWKLFQCVGVESIP